MTSSPISNNPGINLGPIPKAPQQAEQAKAKQPPAPGPQSPAPEMPNMQAAVASQIMPGIAAETNKTNKTNKTNETSEPEDDKELVNDMKSTIKKSAHKVARKVNKSAFNYMAMKKRWFKEENQKEAEEFFTMKVPKVLAKELSSVLSDALGLNIQIDEKEGTIEVGEKPSA